MGCSVQCSMCSMESKCAGKGAGSGAGAVCSGQFTVSSVQYATCHR